MLTNRAGLTYARSGNVYTPISEASTAWTVGEGQKQGSTTFDIKIKKTDGTYSAVTKDLLAGSVGDYYVRVTASNYAKLSLTRTTGAGTDTATPANNFGNPTAAATGALGKTSGAYVDVAHINIDNTGTVTVYKVSEAAANETITWDSGTEYTLANIQAGTAFVSSTVYYGLEVNSGDAQAYSSISSIYAAEANQSKLTPSIQASEAHPAA